MSDLSSDQITLSTCPRDCYDACGLKIRTNKGKIIQVAGDPDHFIARGKLCKKCSIGYNSIWLDEKLRLTQPLKRIGKKGEGEFQSISWETAVTEITDRLKEIVETTGPQSIYTTHYTGTFAAIGYHFPMRFFNRLGATEVNPDSVCNLAGHIALDYVYGSSLDGFDPRTAVDAHCIMVWGANPATAGPHVFEHWLKESHCKTIVIDPIRTETAAAADIHLQPFPGSDAALAFTMMNVIVSEGMTDNEFIESNCQGWPELKQVVDQCSPEWGEKITGVPALDIIEVAKYYASGPSLLWLGQGFQRQPKGGNAMRSCSILPAITGNIGKPGAGFIYLNGAGSRGLDDDYLLGTQLAKSELPSISHMDFASHLEDVNRSQALICWNVNNVASSPEQTRLKNALLRDDLLTVVIDVFSTDTTDYADYVLPAASFLESDDIVIPYFDLTVAVQAKAAEPMGESLPNSEIFRKLAQGMGYTEAALYEDDLTIINALIKQTGLSETIESLKQKGTVPITAKPIMHFHDLDFPTPSRKIELASETALKDGYPLMPEPHADVRPTNDWLRLLTPATPWAMNTTFGNSTKIDKQQSYPVISLHPKDAKERGLVDGDQVLVSNATGQLNLTLTISTDVPVGVALSYKGRWLRRVEGNANVNILNPGQKSDMGGSSAVHGIEVCVEKLTSH